MKAVQLQRHGRPRDACALVDLEEPGGPAAGEVLVAVEATPINPADLLIIEGRYPGPETLPATLGIEGAGRILAVGAGVTGLAEGDPVMIFGRANWVERVCLDAGLVFKLPPELDIVQAAMMKANPASALLMLRDYVALKPGDWVVQNAANSAVGHHVIAFAKARGLHSANVVRREGLEKELNALGGDLVMLDGADLGERMKAAGAAPVRLALDAIGGGATQRLADCLEPGGTVVNYGFLSGEPCHITPHQLIISGLTLKGFWLAGLFRSAGPEALRELYQEIAEEMLSGRLSAPVEAEYPLTRAIEALEHAAKEGRRGKIVLRPGATSA